ncbi:MAG: hypothetical protein QOD42_3799 [Sphingomonadales bacterium]|jgi:hypothetical protein|nr:hypothetical protein [Sphingomonadales bacterium]
MGILARIAILPHRFSSSVASWLQGRPRRGRLESPDRGDHDNGRTCGDRKRGAHHLAVGIIGTEADPANLVYGGVLAIAGALVARFRPHGMALALAATALAQALVAAGALIAGFGQASMVTALFVAPWLVSAWLFRMAARQHPSS